MVELVPTGPAIAVLDDDDTPGMLKEGLVIMVLVLILDNTMLVVAWITLVMPAAAPSHVATQYAFPASMFEHIGEMTAGFHPMKVSTATPNCSATLLQ